MRCYSNRFLGGEFDVVTSIGGDRSLSYGKRYLHSPELRIDCRMVICCNPQSRQNIPSNPSPPLLCTPHTPRFPPPPHIPPLSRQIPANTRSTPSARFSPSGPSTPSPG